MVTFYTMANNRFDSKAVIFLLTFLIDAFNVNSEPNTKGLYFYFNYMCSSFCKNLNE